MLQAGLYFYFHLLQTIIVKSDIKSNLDVIYDVIGLVESGIVS